MSEKQEPGTAFEKRTREVLEESTARLDGRTLSRLTQARHAALDRLQRPVRLRWAAWLPAGAAAAVAVLAVMMWPGSGPEPTADSSSDLEIIADVEAPDFVDDEDLEFYEWAAELENGEIES
jgi:hypothetical protein